MKMSCRRPEDSLYFIFTSFLNLSQIFALFCNFGESRRLKRRENDALLFICYDFL